MSLKIGALEKLSTIDYPNKVSCVVFFKGCNFNCGFCYNKQLVLAEHIDSTPEVTEKEIHYFLDKRKGLLDAVVLSGGEPTIYGHELIDFIKKVKSKGYLVKLDTNGSNPVILKKIISENLVDYIAMDIKDIFDNYYNYTNVPIINIKASLETIKNSSIPHEFRVTTHPDLTMDNFNNILKETKGHILLVQDFMNKNTIKDYKNYKTIYSGLSNNHEEYTLR